MSEKIVILQIEDSESDAALNIRALEKAGFTVDMEMVTTAEEMKAALKKRAYDIVLSDHNLPQFDSSESLAIFNEHKLDIPFIIVSGDIGEETAVKLMKSGAQDYVMKSNLARLAPAIRRELSDAEERRQRKRTGERLRISEERFRQTAEIAGEMIWEVDSQFKYLYVNPVSEVVTGYKPDEIVGKINLFDFFPHTARENYKADFLIQINKNKVLKSFISPRLRKDGHTIILETSATTIMDINGKLIGYRGTDIDITERKRMEGQIRDLYQKEKAQREKLQEEAEVRNLFINVLAHELRNSMTSIVVSSDVLQDTPNVSNDAKNRLVANINTSAKLLTKHLDELLDLARYSKGTFILRREDVEATEYLKQVINRFKPNLDKKHQKLIFEISQTLKERINIDTSRMEQVITNLLSNASKYSPDNTEIRFKVDITETGLSLEITDQGIGISSDEQKHLFQPYYRVNKNSDIPGIGLGLAVSYKIIEAHGGKIQVSSQPGKGSTFSAFIPDTYSKQNQCRSVSSAK